MSFIFTPAKSRKSAEIHIKKASGRDKEFLDKLRGFLDEEEPKCVKWLMSFWDEQQAAITYKEIREAYLEGNITGEELEKWHREYSAFVNEKLAPQWRKAMEQGALNQEYYYLYALTPESVQQYIQNHGAELVTRVVQEQKNAIAAMTARGAYLGMATDELSRIIRPCVGLTAPQSKANLNYYNNMKNTLMKNGMREETAIKRAREKAAKYAAKQHRYRAFNIARTELAYAYNNGSYSAVKDAQAKGFIGEVKKKWLTADDERVCTICGAIDGEKRGMDEVFSIGKLVPPAHPSCRCAVAYEEVDTDGENDIINSRDGLAVNDNANDRGIPRHKPPEKIKDIDITDEKAVMNELLEFEEKAVTEEIETACIITKDGEVIKCYGTADRVFPDTDIGERLRGAVVSHNHPIEKTEFTFSNNDFNLFIDYDLKILRGCDERYIYELRRDTKETDKPMTLKELRRTTDSAQHNHAIEKAKEYGFGYRRRKRETRQ